MADWIKMRSDLYRHPKVILLAAILEKPDSPLCRYMSHWCQCDAAVTRNVMRNATVGALVSVWGVMRHRGSRQNDDLFVPEGCQRVVDDIADMDGFGAAMIEVGWLIETDNSLVFPRFFADHNVDPAEKNRERQRKFREKKRNVTVTLPVTTEKNREEKSRERAEQSRGEGASPLKPQLDISTSKVGVRGCKGEGDSFEEFWQAYPEGRKEKKAKAHEAWIKAIRKASPETIIAAAVEYADSYQAKSQFVKGPVPWLNGGCWDDDRAAWNRTPDPRGSRALMEAFYTEGESYVEEG